MGSISINDRSAVKADLDNERRSIADLWNDALRAYKGTVGTDLRPYYRDVDEMISDGIRHMDAFKSWRDDGSKVARLRSLFMANIGYIEKGCSKLVEAASASFPPAQAIGTCLTFVLAGCKSMSADLDLVVVFFEDLNSFLQRLDIIETRVPRVGAYRTILMDVFTSLLKMMAIAQKYIGEPRFKKWLKNSFLGQDSELAGSRKAMDKALARLQSATEFAILRNSEDAIESQRELRRMQDELYRNQLLQQRITANNSLMLDTILARQDNLKGGINSLQGGMNNLQDGVENMVQILKSWQEEKRAEAKQALQAQSKSAQSKSAQTKPNTNKNTRNWVRSVLPEVPECKAELRQIEMSAVEGTGQFIFGQPAWSNWEDGTGKASSPPLLVIKGAPGIGKSHLAASAFNYFQQQILHDSQHKICATYFCFRKDVDLMSELDWAFVSCLLQISDQSTFLRGQLGAILSPEDYEMPQIAREYWDKLIAPIFGKTSSYQLYMVLDGLDEMSDDSERNDLIECVKHIKEQELRIKILCTARTECTLNLDQFHAVEMPITRELILPDLKKIIRDRLQSPDSAYSGLQRFSRFLKVRILSSIEQHADGLVYVEQMLRYVSSIGREGAVLKIIEDDMPDSINDLFARLLKQCKRRVPQDSFLSMKSLLAWVSFCFRPLLVDEANALLSFSTPNNEINVEEEVQDTFSQFLQIGSTLDAGDSDSGAAIGTAIPLSAVSPSRMMPEFDDGKLQITFRERSMREFLTGSSIVGNGDLRTPAIHAHSQIFLLCSKVINEYAVGTGSHFPAANKLREYAHRYCLRHWCYIDPREHSDSENVAIVEAFTSIVMDGHFAKGIEALGSEFMVDGILEDAEDQFNSTWRDWSQWVDGAPMKKYVDKSTLEYWTGGADNALTPLAKSHIKNWFNATDRKDVIRSYGFARSAIKCTKHKHLLDKHFDEEDSNGDEPQDDTDESLSEREILGLAQLFGLNLTSNAHYAIGVQLHIRGDQEKAVSEVQLAIETCHDHNEQARNYEQLAKISLDMDNCNDALHYTELSLSCSDRIRPAILNDVLLTKGLAQMALHSFGDASQSFAKARLCNPDIVEGENLWHEVYTYWESGDIYSAMETVVNFKPIERLNLFTYANEWSEWFEPDVHILLLRVSARSRQSDVLADIYQDVIKTLDAENAGAPLRLNLAYLHWRVRRDTAAAKEILNQVLDSSSNGEGYKLTDCDPVSVAVRAINIMSDILFGEFQDSKDPNLKAQILTNVKELQYRNLPQLLQIPTSQLIPYYLVLAKMLRKMGPASEYEKIMNQAFNICIDNLNDSVTWNDSINVFHLAMVLVQMGSLKTQAEILNSAQFYWLDPQAGTKADDDDSVDDSGDDGEDIENTADVPSQQNIQTVHIPIRDKNNHWHGLNGVVVEANHADEVVDPEGGVANGSDRERSEAVENVSEADSEYDLISDGTNSQYCKGQCFPRADFDCWDEKKPMYQCLNCTESVLCQQCYDIRMKYNAQGRDKTEPDFCCNKGKYLRGPAVGWKGIKDGRIYFEGDLGGSGESREPVKFTDFLETIKAAWKDAWEEYWTTD